MSVKPFNLPEIQADLQSPEENTRSRAMDRLAVEVKTNPGIRETALAIFRATIQNPRDIYATIHAAQGIEAIASPDESRQVWLALLNDPRPAMVKPAACLARDRSFGPTLIALLSKRQEPEVREVLVRALGRMREPAALGPMLECLADPALRPHVVEALADYNDSRGIPMLIPLLQDKTPAWPVDNHGPMLRVCDLAQDTIERLRRS